MLKTTLTILTILLLTTFVDLFGQTNYSKFVNPMKQYEKQHISTNDDGSEDITYLGTIHDKSGQVIYHVLSVFRLVQAAIEKHGHSELVFLDNSLDLVKKYSLGLPDELPFELKDNSLSFYYTDEKTKTRKIFQNEIGRQLPGLLCVSPNICY